jgi:hypothetical protein
VVWWSVLLCHPEWTCCPNQTHTHAHTETQMCVMHHAWFNAESILPHPPRRRTRTHWHQHTPFHPLLLQVRSMFYHGYEGYLNYAYPKDELCPLTCTGKNTWGSYALTLVDTLDTLVILGTAVLAASASPPLRFAPSPSCPHLPPPPPPRPCRHAWDARYGSAC